MADPIVLPGVPLEGLHGWVLDFDWREAVPNNGTPGCAAESGKQCRCGSKRSHLPGIEGGFAEIVKQDPHDARSTWFHWRVSFPGGLSRQGGADSWGQAVINVHERLVDALETLPRVWVIPLRWSSVYSVRVVSPTHGRVAGHDELPETGNDEEEFVRAVSLGLGKLQKPAAVSVVYGKSDRFKSAYCCGFEHRGGGANPWTEMRGLAKKHGIRLLCEMPETVEELALSWSPTPAPSP
jgi:hypothetical protein